MCESETMIKTECVTATKAKAKAPTEALTATKADAKTKSKAKGAYKYPAEGVEWGVPMIKGGAYYTIVSAFRAGLEIESPPSTRGRRLSTIMEAHMYDDKAAIKNTLVAFISDPVLHTSTVEFNSSIAYEVADKARRMFKTKDMGVTRAMKVSTVTYGGAYKNRGRLAILTHDMADDESANVTYANLSNSVVFFTLVTSKSVSTCMFTDATLSVLNDVYMSQFAHGAWYDYESNESGTSFFVCTHVNQATTSDKYESRLMVYPLGSAFDASSSHARITGEGKLQFSGKPKFLSVIMYAVKALLTTAVKTSTKAFIRSLNVVESEDTPTVLHADSASELGTLVDEVDMSVMSARMSESKIVETVMAMGERKTKVADKVVDSSRD